MITVIRVKNKKELSDFIKFPFVLYKGNPNWVPPLISEMKERFNFHKNPYMLHSEVQPFLAYREGKVVGRITAHTNRQHNSTHNDKVGFFGFFDCINDTETAKVLFNKAEYWLKEKGCDAMRGPMNFSVNEETGLLVDGFDTPPYIMMPYHLQYYQNLFEQCGLTKIMDLFAYQIKVQKTPDKIARLTEKLQKRGNFTVRSLSTKRSELRKDVEKVFEIYTKAWENNWGDVPLTKNEFEATVKQILPIVRPEFVYIAEVDGKPAGFSLTLPDFHFILKKMNGHIFPFGFLKALYYKNKITRLRVLAMGVIKEYQNRGIDTVFYAKSFDTAFNHKLKWEFAEFSWVLEINEMMNKIAVHLGGKHYKTYRIYQRIINEV
jgi:GNAT superfamily N-acetyltransferase